MMMTEVHVRALKDTDYWFIDCTVCGPVGILDATDNPDDTCLRHLQAHGADDIHRTEVP